MSMALNSTCINLPIILNNNANSFYCSSNGFRFLNHYSTITTHRSMVVSSSSSSRTGAISTEDHKSVDGLESSVLDVEKDVIKSSSSTSSSPSKLVLVVGGTGGVGQLVVASLLDRNIKARLILRNPEKAASLFGKQEEDKLQVYKGDTRDPTDLHPSMFEGVTHVICCTGTTAFPSRRWDGDNTPEKTGKVSETLCRHYLHLLKDWFLFHQWELPNLPNYHGVL
ncbi:hypothetical protein Leryth_003851 [Lithospermum erythrorhizon]|nr:hypothetical protein Leryth_003851 [Lithospermum erythrorhizon]